MLSIPLPFVTALLLSILLVRLRQTGPIGRSALFFVGACTALAIIVGRAGPTTFKGSGSSYRSSRRCCLPAPGCLSNNLPTTGGTVENGRMWCRSQRLQFSQSPGQVGTCRSTSCWRSVSASLVRPTHRVLARLLARAWRYLRGRNRAGPPALRNKIDIKDIGRRRQEVSTSLSRRPKESSSRV